MVARVRSFSRIVTERVGALDERFLGRGRPLGEARLLWEIGPDGPTCASCAAGSSSTPGYASRLLRSLEAQGLVDVEAPAGDRRVRRARLTAAGLAERAVLDGLADELAAAMLEPLDERRARPPRGGHGRGRAPAARLARSRSRRRTPASADAALVHRPVLRRARAAVHRAVSTLR